MVSVVPEDLDVHEEFLIENRLYLLGNTEEYSSKMPLIFREEGSATRVSMDKYFKMEKRRKQIELTSNEAVKQAVIAGLGYSLMPLIGTKNELLNKEIHILPARGLPIISGWRLIWLKNKKLSPVAQEFLHFIQQQKGQIIEKHFSWYLNFK